MADLGMVIVGAGEAGARAAVELRTAGYGGSITLIGKEKLMPYERPPLSKSVITDENDPTPATILDEAKLAEYNIQFVNNQAVLRINRERHELALSSGEIRYERLLLATGAYPRQLAMEGSDHAELLMLRTFADALDLRSRLLPGKHVAIVGAGFIGLELAASAREIGCEATVIEVGPRILGRGVPVEIASLVEARHRQAGVAFHLGTGIERIVRTQAGHVITLQNDILVECDTVIVGIGAIPETSLAATSGLTVENGIWTNGRLQTSDPDIYAAGDCCSFPHPLYGGRRIRLESWRNAQDQGTHVAHNMLGADKPYADLPWFWSDQYELTLQVAGLTDCGAKLVIRNISDTDKFFFHLSEDNRLMAASAVGLNAKIAKDIRLAEMLIQQQTVLDPNDLERPDVKLKGLLK